MSAELLAEIDKAGFVEASPIQEQTIPLAMAGKDVIGQAQTGTGKTAAFGFPTLEKIDTEDPTVQALIIAPTRELAVQKNSLDLVVVRVSKSAQFMAGLALKSKLKL